MKNWFAIFLSLIICLNVQAFAISSNIDKDTTIKNRLFSITIPKEFNGLYEIQKEKDKISIYHKDSKKAGFGGFVFGIKAYKNPADHATLPGGKKIGELRGKSFWGKSFWGKSFWGKFFEEKLSRKSPEILYDMVLKYPTDVQYDYTKGVNPPDSYKRLYDFGNNGVNIKGVNGFVYLQGQGTKGEDLYQDVLKKHITAVNEKWDSTKLEQENLSYMYNIIPKDKIGYAYYDVNADGIDELLIGEIAESAWKGVIYDIYTMVDRAPRHVISGGARDRYYVCDYTFVCNEYSSGALESGVRVFNLVENSIELFPQVSFKYDGYTNPKSPWFLSYSDGKWENVSEQKYEERKHVFEKYERFDFIPLSKIKL